MRRPEFEHQGFVEIPSNYLIICLLFVPCLILGRNAYGLVKIVGCTLLCGLNIELFRCFEYEIFLLCSSRIARQEDEEQRILIEEEERLERMRQAKKRKMGH